MKAARPFAQTIWLVFVLTLAACATPQATLPNAQRYEAADRLFHTDPLWLGGDAAASIPLDGDRILWLFGDSFIATPKSPTRKGAAFIRNSVAIESGMDPRTATLSFAWRQDARGAPASFFAESGKNWYWPGHGIRLDNGPLVVFLSNIAAAPGQALAFKTMGSAIAFIDNPDHPPQAWTPRIVDVPAPPFDAHIGTAVIRDGDHIVALATRQKGTHAGTFVRYRAYALAKGDLTSAEWWTGDTRGWRRAKDIGPAGPAFVIDDAGAEASIHWDADARLFVHTASLGFGASTIATRTAPKLTGPWSAPREQFRPPESSAQRPFVYAGKAHPELGADGDAVLVTYIASSLTPDDLLTPEGQANLYWPRFVRIPVTALRD